MSQKDVRFVLEWNKAEIEAWRGGKMEAAVTAALRKAGTSGLQALKAEASRRIRERKRMKAERVNRGLMLVYPAKSATLENLTWRMLVSGRPTPVSAFPHRQTKRGVSVEINRGRRVLIQSAFVTTMKSGHLGVFLRRRVAGPMRPDQTKRSAFLRVARLPLDEAKTSSLRDVFRDGDFIPGVYARGQSVFESAFRRLLPLELEKAKK